MICHVAPDDPLPLGTSEEPGTVADALGGRADESHRGVKARVLSGPGLIDAQRPFLFGSSAGRRGIQTTLQVAAEGASERLTRGDWAWTQCLAGK